MHSRTEKEERRLGTKTTHLCCCHQILSHQILSHQILSLQFLILILILILAAGASRSLQPTRACGHKHILSGRIRLLAFLILILLAFQILQAFQ